jgi:copper resistance protein B
MKRLVLLAAATCLASSPASAQMNMNMPGMHMPGMKMPPPKRKAAPTKKKAAQSPRRATIKARSKKAVPTKPAAKAAGKTPVTGGHEDHDMSSMPGMKMPPGQTMENMPGMNMPPGHTMENMPGMNMPPGHTMENMPGMNMPPGHTMENMPGMNMPPGHTMENISPGEQAGHKTATMGAPEPPVGPPPPVALHGPENAADTVYGAAAMQSSRSFLLSREHGGMTAAKLLVEEAETRMKKGRDGYYLNGAAWYGGDINKLWLKTEIEGDYGRKSDRAEFQALWSHAIDPWWDFQAGVRLDTDPRRRGRLAMGFQGLAPYWIETEATAFISTRGDITARLDAEHDVRITQKLMLQPRVELNFALQDIPSERVGSGLSTADLGLRLRYAFVPNVAPYVGVRYDGAIGATRKIRRSFGEATGGIEILTGIRGWF